MSLVHRSLFLSAVERYASLVVFFFSTAALARILTPREFGVYAVVSAITTVAAVSSQEFGGANYIIQKSDLTGAHVRTAFTITFALSLAFGATLGLLAGVLGAWFGVEGVGAGIRIAALGFLVSPFTTTLVALLRRDLSFGAIATGNLINNLTTAALSVALAYAGYSYQAPLWGQLAGAVLQTAYLTAVRGNVGLFRFSLAARSEIFGFGLYSFGVALINLAYNAAPQVFLARLLGFDSVGLYSRAVAIGQIFDRLVVQAVSPVVMPAFAAQVRAGEDLKRGYLHAATLLTALHWPFLLAVALLAEPLIRVWLGPSWLPAAPLVRLYCLGYLALFAASLTYPVLVAAGGVRDALASSAISLPPSLAILFAASFFGVEAVAASALLTMPLQAEVALRFIARRLGFGFRELAQALAASAFVAICSAAAAALGAGLIAEGALRPLAGLAFSGALVSAAWLAAMVAAQHPLLQALKQTAASLRWPAPRLGVSRPAQR